MNNQKVDNILQEISDRLTAELIGQLNRCGMMFRLFSRVKTLSSIHHKVKNKGHLYASGEAMIQDIIGLRIVTYFQDDIDALSFYFSCGEVVKSSIDELDSSTFCPQRLNLTRKLPADMREAFRRAIPEEYAQYIDDTYEIQIRTIFSEGWHEVEHDLRYKCKNDWTGCEDYSRILNGVIATLEMSEWNMKSLFDDMACRNLRQGNFRAMLRNRMRLRIKGDDFSPEVNGVLKQHPEIAEKVYNVERMILLLTMLNHSLPLELTYDNLLFLINRIEINDPLLKELEPEGIRETLNLLAF